MADLLSIDDLPPDFEYPPEFIRVVELGLTNLEPWWIVQGQLLRDRFQGLRKRYPDRNLILFAVRQDNDDVACWDIEQGNVAVVHDFSSSGFERRGEFPGHLPVVRTVCELRDEDRVCACGGEVPVRSSNFAKKNLERCSGVSAPWAFMYGVSIAAPLMAFQFPLSGGEDSDGQIDPGDHGTKFRSQERSSRLPRRRFSLSRRPRRSVMFPPRLPPITATIRSKLICRAR